MSEKGFEVVGIEIGELSSDLEAVTVMGSAYEVHGHVAHDRHVLRARSGPQAHEIVVEDDVEHPVQAVLNLPVRPHGGREGLGVELGRREILAEER